MNRPLQVSIAILLAFVGGVVGYQFQQNDISHLPDSNAGVDQALQTEEDLPSISIIGQRRPEFVMDDINGERRHISEWDGHVLAINFWATWCAPCLKEVPEFIQLQDKYSEKGLQFVGIALQKPAEVREFAREYAMNYPVFAGELEVVRLAQVFGNDIGGLPYTVIIDKTGLVNFVKHGPLSMDEAEAIILDLL
jgi:thiol-disulfide isomerase/thioredoxin